MEAVEMMRLCMVARGISFCIRVYQYSLSPLFSCLGCGCRYYPSCSHYAITCLQRYRFVRALGMIGGRLLRCHPFAPGGIDLP